MSRAGPWVAMALLACAPSSEPGRAEAPPPVAAASEGVPAVPAPTFHFQVVGLSPERRTAMTGVSWHEGCPVGLDALRLVTLSHWGFDGAVHEGELVVRDTAVEAVRAAFRVAFDAGFPIQRMEPIDHYGGDDDASMAANNTSAFNCRAITGGTGWSEHAHGHALDVNPVQNPYVRGGRVLPPGGSAYLDRSDTRPGMLQADSALVMAFESAGWTWGGRWTRYQDFQHLSAAGH